MRTTVETVEPFILESRETVKLIVHHLLAAKGGDVGRLREALHETRALTYSSRQANFLKVTHLASHMESLIEAAEAGSLERLSQTLELLCDMCAHIVLYVDTVLLYADTIAMVLEFPWMRDAMSRRLSHLSPENLLREPIDEMMAPGAPDRDEAVVHLDPCTAESDPEGTLDRIERSVEETPGTCDLVVDVSRMRDIPLWLVGALVSYHMSMRRQGRRIRFAGLTDEGESNCALRRLSDRIGSAPPAWAM